MDSQDEGKSRLARVGASVQSALAKVKQEFSSYRMHDTTDFCDHCSSLEYMNDLNTTPLDDISVSEMFDVTYSLGSTFGSLEDCRYFVPRFCADGLTSRTSELTLAFAKMKQTFATWSPSERQAVQQFLLAQWHFVLLTRRSDEYQRHFDAQRHYSSALRIPMLSRSLSPPGEIVIP